MTRSAHVLNELLEVARDGERFYRHAAERVDSPALKGTFRQMAEVRQRLMDDLAHHVSARGAEPSDDRTFWGTSRKVYADVLASIRPDDEDVYLAQLEAVEDRLLRHYEKAVEEIDGEPARQILRRHLMTVRAAHDRMRALRDQSAPA